MKLRVFVWMVGVVTLTPFPLLAGDLNNTIPTITSLSPSSAATGGPPFTLTVNGNAFTPSSVIQWNGSNRTTSYVSATQLSTDISTADIAVGQNAAILVTIPGQQGGTSAEVSFAVNTLSPSVATIYPSSAAAGAAGLTLTVSGSNFVPGSSVQWNGSGGQPPLSTIYVSSNELTVSIPASDIAFAGDANVTVVNPAPGGGTSGAAVFTIAGSIPSNVSFVAPNGNDSNPGTITRPYLTIQRCATTVSSGAICAIRAGTYRETVTPNSGITITSFDGEPVTVDGSDPVTGWTQYQGSIYQASVALNLADENQVFVGNQMMTEARWPNGNDLFHVNWATLGAGTTTMQLVDSNLPNINWLGAKIHFLSGSDPDHAETAAVTASAPGELSFTLDGTECDPGDFAEPGGYYYLYRSLAALDTQKEWYYDPNAMVLYFWAPGGLNPNSLNVTVKQRQYAFDLSGESNVTIEYLNLFASSISTNGSSTNDTIDGIRAEYVSHYTDITNPPGFTSACVIHAWDTGIILYGSGNVLQDSAIEWSAGQGVALGGQGNTVKNNLIDHVDYMGSLQAGIDLSGTGQTVQYNTVYATGHYGIYMDPWYYGSAVGPPNGTNVDVSYNNVFSAMMLSTDAGAIYAWEQPGFGPVTGTTIHNNWLHDTQALLGGQQAEYPLPGVYLDTNATGFVVTENVLWNNQNQNILLNGGETNGPSENNSVYNNSIPDVNTTGYIWLHEIVNCGTTQIVNNLVLVPVQQSYLGAPSPCTATDNSSTAPGATQMSSSVQVGCNFAGCWSEGPPAISGTSVAASIAVQPYGMTVDAGQPAAFTVTGAGSPPLSYQWQRNGANITGATGATYTISGVSAADNGASYAVTVSNVLGSVTSSPATLTVLVGTQPALDIGLSHVGNFTQGQTGAAYTVVVSNSGSAGPAGGTVTVTEIPPAGLTVTSMAGLGWSCSTSACTASNVLAAGFSYPAITVTVNVANDANSPQVNQVSVSGGGSASASASDSTTIAIQSATPPAPFFTGEASLGSGVDYLQFPDGVVFGYYTFAAGTIFYHFDMGYEAFVPGSASDVYLFDFGSGHWWYTSSTLFPYLYDFTLKTWIYYFPNTANPGHYTSNPRYFSNLTTGLTLTM